MNQETRRVHYHRTHIIKNQSNLIDSSTYSFNINIMSKLIYQKRELRIMKILETFQNDVYINVNECAREFQANRRNLTNQWSEMQFKSIRFSICRRHIEIQKRMLVDYIKHLDDMNMSLIIEFVVNVVNRLLFANVKLMNSNNSNVFSINIQICVHELNDLLLLLKNKSSIYFFWNHVSKSWNLR